MKQAKERTIVKVFWACLTIGALPLCAAVYYWKYPDVRELVDGKFPFIKHISTATRSYFHAADDKPWPDITPAPADARSTPLAISATPEVIAKPIASLLQIPAAPQPITLHELDQFRSQWPKDVVLKKAADFPAVMNGKVVGTVTAAAGTEVQLVEIKDGKVSVEFQGGGAMVNANDTDLLERIQAVRKAGTSR